MRGLLFSLLAAGLATGCVRTPSAETAKLEFVTIDPAHFHAALVQKWTYPQVSRTVRVFAPAGSELDAHLAFISAFNTRAEDPTDWREIVCRSDDFLAAFRKYAATRPHPERTIVVLAGRNDRKADYALAAVQAGMNVLADKPLAIDVAGWRKIDEAVRLARQRHLAFMDLMTDRTNAHNALAVRLMGAEAVYGRPEKGTADDPAVESSSLHHFLKTVNGAPLRRPAWYYDVACQGEGLVDVTTHVFDAVRRALCGDAALRPEDVCVVSAKAWPTIVTRDDYRQSTGVSEWPSQLKAAVGTDGALRCRANGSFVCSMKGTFVRIRVAWNVRAAAGGGDEAASRFRGSRADVSVEPDRTRGGALSVFVRPRAGADLTAAVRDFVAQERKTMPDLAVTAVKDGWRFDIPASAVIAHEPSFAAFTRQYLGWVERRNQPAAEYDNLVEKYRVLTTAAEKAKD